MIYIHYGSATHRPMQTVRVSSFPQLKERVYEARREKTPFTVQVGDETYNTSKAISALLALIAPTTSRKGSSRFGR